MVSFFGNENPSLNDEANPPVATDPNAFAIRTTFCVFHHASYNLSNFNRFFFDLTLNPNYCDNQLASKEAKRPGAADLRPLGDLGPVSRGPPPPQVAVGGDHRGAATPNLDLGHHPIRRTVSLSPPVEGLR